MCAAAGPGAVGGLAAGGDVVIDAVSGPFTALACGKDVVFGVVFLQDGKVVKRPCRNYIGAVVHRLHEKNRAKLRAFFGLCN